MKTHQLYKLFIASTGISTDTRTIEKGNLFFALKGKNFNGNTFAQFALNKGAAFAIVDEKKYALNKKTLWVDDGLQTLQHLATHHRKQLKTPIIAITGSNGKTTTKELIHLVLRQKYSVFATQGNLNNHIGVPLNLLSLKKEHQLGIIEMGANHLGEIAALCKITQPNYGLITNIGVAHIEGFGSTENVFKAKGELYDYLRISGGKVFYCSTHNYLNEMSTDLQRISYGFSDNDYLQGESFTSLPYLKVVINGNNCIEIQTQLIGNYNVENVLAAACVGKYLDVSYTKIKNAIEAYKPKNNRSEFVKKGNNQFILDAYNANPSSMKAALQNFSQINHKQKAVVLGEMNELGTDSESHHDEIVRLVGKISLKEQFFVGESFKKAAEQADQQWFADINALKAWFAMQQFNGFLFLIKGSRGMKLEQLLQ